MTQRIPHDLQFYKFCAYGFFKNLKFFDPFIILFFREMGLSFLQIGLLYSIREISINILEIPTGIVADLWGRRRVMISAFSSYLASFLFFYFLGFNFWFSAGGMILFALGETLRSGTHKAMILEYLKLRGWTHLKVDYYGRTRSCSQLGSALSSLIAATLVFYSGSYRIVFLASTVPYVIDLILMTTYPKELDGELSRKPKKLRDYYLFSVESFRVLLKNERLWRTLLNSSLISSAFKVSKDYLQPILKKWAIALPVLLFLTGQQRTAILVGITYFIIYLFSSQASRRAGDVQRKIGSSAATLNWNYLINVGIYMVAGVGFMLGLYIIPLISFIGIFVIQSFQKPVMVGYVGEVADSKRMATILSVENQSRAIIIALFAPLVGLLVDHFSVGGGLLGYALILLLLFPLARVR